MLPFLPGHEVEQIQQLNLSPSKDEIPELVFFGRLEGRKGLELFCDALDMMNHYYPTPKDVFSVSFLGKIAEINGDSSDEYIHSRAASGSWSFQYTILSKFNRSSALQYLKSSNRLAVRFLYF